MIGSVSTFMSHVFIFSFPRRDGIVSIELLLNALLSSLKLFWIITKIGTI